MANHSTSTGRRRSAWRPLALAAVVGGVAVAMGGGPR